MSKNLKILPLLGVPVVGCLVSCSTINGAQKYIVRRPVFSFTPPINKNTADDDKGYSAALTNAEFQNSFSCSSFTRTDDVCFIKRSNDSNNGNINLDFEFEVKNNRFDEPDNMSKVIPIPLAEQQHTLFHAENPIIALDFCKCHKGASSCCFNKSTKLNVQVLSCNKKKLTATLSFKPEEMAKLKELNSSEANQLNNNLAVNIYDDEIKPINLIGHFEFKKNDPIFS